LATLGAFFLVRSAGITLAQEDLIPAAFAPWLPLALILLGTMLALRRSWAR
jgi:lipopolysaccharide export LptBFGC system permease protein LptF